MVRPHSQEKGTIIGSVVPACPYLTSDTFTSHQHPHPHPYRTACSCGSPWWQQQALISSIAVSPTISPPPTFSPPKFASSLPRQPARCLLLWRAGGRAAKASLGGRLGGRCRQRGGSAPPLSSRAAGQAAVSLVLSAHISAAHVPRPVVGLWDGCRLRADPSISPLPTFFPPAPASSSLLLSACCLLPRQAGALAAYACRWEVRFALVERHAGPAAFLFVHTSASQVLLTLFFIFIIAAASAPAATVLHISAPGSASSSSSQQHQLPATSSTSPSRCLHALGGQALQRGCCRGSHSRPQRPASQNAKQADSLRVNEHRVR